MILLEIAKSTFYIERQYFTSWEKSPKYWEKQLVFRLGLYIMFDVLFNK